MALKVKNRQRGHHSVCVSSYLFKLYLANRK